MQTCNFISRFLQLKNNNPGQSFRKASCFFPLNLAPSQKTDPLKSKQQLDLERAHFLVTQAFDEDEKGNREEAVELYTEAVELCLKTVC